MNALRNKRTVRKTQPALERLDLRLAPTSMSVAAGLASALRVEARQLHRLQASLERANPGSRHASCPEQSDRSPRANDGPANGAT